MVSNRKKSARERNRQQVLKVLNARRRQQRRRRLWLRVGAPVLVVLLVVATMVLVKLTGRQGATADAASDRSSPAPAAVVSGVTALPTTVSDAVGAGSAGQVLTRISGAPLTVDGLPRVVYVGAEYCPYCAAERWPLVIALARFGTFGGLGATASSPDDVYPSTATLSFHGSTYHSDYLAFSPYEIQSNLRQGSGYATLDTVPAADEQLVQKYNPKGSIPFLDLGNSFVLVGATYDAGLLAGLTRQQIVARIADPSDPVSKAVVGNANVITAALCTVTGEQPASVCNSSAVVAGKRKLPS